MSRVVFTFGRFNPPTVGHEKLIKKVEKVAAGDNFYIYPSWSENPKKDPLPHKVKYEWMRKIFPKYKNNIISNPKCKTAIHVLTKYEEFNEVAMVVGSDRVNDFQNLFDKYNGVESAHGFYKFDKIEVVSAGERDPDAAGVSGMSASKMRQAAVDGDFNSFKTGIPDTVSEPEKKKLFRDVQKYMGIEEEFLWEWEFIDERTLTDDEKKKLKEIVKALKRDFPDWEKSKMYAIATATAKKWWDRRKRWKDPWTDKKPKKLKAVGENMDELKTYKEFISERSIDLSATADVNFVMLDKRFIKFFLRKLYTSIGQYRETKRPKILKQKD